MLTRGLAYNTIAKSKSAISHIISWDGYRTIDDHPEIHKYMKGVFSKRPTLPRYTAIWDISVLLSYYQNSSDNANLSFEKLTHKIVMLLLILSFQRKQSIHQICRDNIKIMDTKMILLPNSVLKHTTPYNPLEPIEYDRYSDTKLCVVNCMEHYCKHRDQLITGMVEKLLITHKRPHGPASSDTVSRWVKTELKASGINVVTFKAHSTRAAASSKAKQKGASISNILKKGRWKSHNVFRKHYDKHIINNNVDSSFSGNILMEK